MNNRIIIPIIIAIVIVGSLASYTGYVSADIFNPYQKALGQLARAETSQMPNEVIEHVMIAKTELSGVGYVSWWSTDKETFDSIEVQLDSIITRAENISSLELGDDLFNLEMSGIHSELRSIQESLLAF